MKLLTPIRIEFEAFQEPKFPEDISTIKLRLVTGDKQFTKVSSINLNELLCEGILDIIFKEILLDFKKHLEKVA